MQKDDVPMLGKAPAQNVRKSTGVEQLAFPHFPMGTDICYIDRTSSYNYQNRESEQTVAVGKETCTTNYPWIGIWLGV